MLPQRFLSRSGSLGVLGGLFTARFASTCLASMLLATLCGCGGTQEADARPKPGKQLSDAELRAELDDVLQAIYHNRRLDTDRNAAWQIMHGVVAFERDLQIRHKGQLVGAIDYVLNGGTMKGWVFEPGDTDPETGRPGLRAIVEPGSKTGQGHADQWLGYMAQCGLSPEETIVIDGQSYSIADYIWQIQQDVYRNAAEEYSWTLMALSSYLPSTARWISGDGKEWSIEKLVDIETRHDLGSSACGGSHRLAGLTMAVNQHLAQGGKLEGVWERADQKIKDSIATVQKFQNPDGTFSSNYFTRTGRAVDVANQLSTTGHTLEFLMLAMTDDEVHQEWVRRAVIKLCQLFRSAEKIDLECGGLYHATHGLILYRQRMFGPIEFGPSASPPASEAGDPSASD